ncbi:MAG TPA: efflux RND transporter periplasmic adaptor subunit [Polyangiaceae bacterium]|nr:efflux RND transporter periplasmic adaptor subunit [Polyangiaceae bacterium]
MSITLRRLFPHFAGLTLSASLVVVAVAAPGCKRKTDAAPAPAAPAVAVATDVVTNIETPRTLRLTGTLRGERETDLAANVAGRVLSVKIERGQRVAKGELIAQVDVTGAALALAEARVAVQTSKTQEAINRTDCDRYERLKASNTVTELEYDQVTAKCKTAPLNREAAEARQNIAAKNVGDGRIRSPFAGVITDRYIQVGEYVQASTRVASLAQVADLRLEFSLPEQNYPDVQVGQNMGFRVAAYGTQLFSGTVSHISGAVRETRDVLVEASVKNPEHKLLPGMFADVELTVGKETLPSIPKAAGFQANGKLNVFVVQGGVLVQRVLQVGPEVEGRLSVRRGVVAGEQVVASYSPELKNGQRVK